MSNRRFGIQVGYSFGVIVSKEDLFLLLDILDRAEYSDQGYGSLKITPEFPKINLYTYTNQEIAIAKGDAFLSS